MKQEEIKAFLLTQGFNEDRYGHMLKKFENKIRRYKFQKHSVRVETRANRPHSRWLNENYGKVMYYKYLEIVNNKIVFF